LPERGISIGISGKDVDLDYWQRMLARPGKAAAQTAADVPVSVDLKAEKSSCSAGPTPTSASAFGYATSLWRGTVQSGKRWVAFSGTVRGPAS
jgi:hypothetical protein